jgi:molecular chaperone GrpE
MNRNRQFGNQYFMAKTSGKSEVKTDELDLERELPPAEGGDEEPRDAAVLKLKAERDSLLDRVARLQAEFENARKRASREQQEFRDYALADTVKTFLPVVDSFELALRAEGGKKSEFRSGVELIYKQLQDALLKLGLQPIEAKGSQFDPHLHEAIEMVDTTDAPDHEVLDELQRGYKLKDRLVRPAMVRVARNPK